jgi:hypothetical protein
MYMRFYSYAKPQRVRILESCFLSTLDELVAVGYADRFFSCCLIREIHEDLAWRTMLASLAVNSGRARRRAALQKTAIEKSRGGKEKGFRFSSEPFFVW